MILYIVLSNVFLKKRELPFEWVLKQKLKAENSYMSNNWRNFQPLDSYILTSRLSCLSLPAVSSAETDDNSLSF